MPTANSVARAAVFLDAGRPDEALTLLSAHLASEPDDVRALCLITRAYVATGHAQEGVASGKRAVSLAPDSEWALRALASAFSTLGRHADAKAAAVRARELAPNSWLTHCQVASVDTTAKDITSETRVAALRAVQLAPNEPLAHYQLGNVALAMSELDSAESAYRRALALDPQMEPARNNLAIVTLRQGSAGAAAASFVDILADNPTSTLARRNTLAAISATVARARFLLGAGVVAANLMWNITHGQGEGSGQAGIIAAAAAVGLGWIVLTVNFVAGAGFRLRYILRAVWRFDRTQCGIVLVALVVYASLVVAAAEPQAAAFWIATSIVLYFGLFLFSVARRNARK